MYLIVVFFFSPEMSHQGISPVVDFAAHCRPTAPAMEPSGRLPPASSAAALDSVLPPPVAAAPPPESPPETSRACGSRGASRRCRRPEKERKNITENYNAGLKKGPKIVENIDAGRKKFPPQAKKYFPQKFILFCIYVLKIRTLYRLKNKTKYII